MTCQPLLVLFSKAGPPDLLIHPIIISSTVSIYFVPSNYLALENSSLPPVPSDLYDEFSKGCSLTKFIFLFLFFSRKLNLATFSTAYRASALGELGSMLFYIREQRLIGMAVRIFGKKGAGGGIGSYGAAAVTKSKIVTLKAILLLNENPRSGLQALAGTTFLHQIREAFDREDVTEVEFRVAGRPTIALSDITLRIYTDELIDAVIPPNTGKPGISFVKILGQLVKGANFNSFLVTALDPNIC
jgi:hypothetical protein